LSRLRRDKLLFIIQIIGTNHFLNQLFIS